MFVLSIFEWLFYTGFTVLSVSKCLELDQAQHLSPLIWIQFVGKSYKQGTLAGKKLIKSLQRCGQYANMTFSKDK